MPLRRAPKLWQGRAQRWELVRRGVAGGGGDARRAASAETEAGAEEARRLHAERALLHEMAKAACAAAMSLESDGSEDAGAAFKECAEFRKRVEDFEAFFAQRFAGGEAVDFAHWGGSLYGRQPTAGSDAHDALLSQLAAVTGVLQEHVVAPPSAELQVAQFAERVAFHLYVVHGHSSFTAEGPGFLDIEAFKLQLLSLRLPQQHFTFTTHRINMYDDPGLALAFSTSMRHAVLPTLRMDGTFVAAESLFVDSLELRRMLRSAAATIPDAPAGVQTSRVVPVFFFSADAELPLFIDRYFVARTVEDMVIVVQSDFPEWESRMLCGQSHLRWNLRGPLRAALAATAQLLGGLLPPHLSYQSERKRAQQNWLWSVGDSPLAYTSSAAEFGEHYSEVLHRHYVVGALNASVAVTRQVVQLLSNLRTTRANAALLEGGEGAEAPPFLRLQSAFAKVGQLQKRIQAHAARADFDLASVLLHSLQKDSSALLELAHEVARAFVPLRCVTGHERSPLERWLSGGTVAPALLMLTGCGGMPCGLERVRRCAFAFDSVRACMRSPTCQLERVRRCAFAFDSVRACMRSPTCQLERVRRCAFELDSVRACMHALAHLPLCWRPANVTHPIRVASALMLALGVQFRPRRRKRPKVNID